MDKAAGAAYPADMLARLVSVLAVLAVVVVTTAAAAHAARMAGVPDRAMHHGAMMQAGHAELPSCGETPCGPADADLCALVCAGLSVFLPPPGPTAGPAAGPAAHAVAPGTAAAGLAPGLNERPPRHRFA